MSAGLLLAQPDLVTRDALSFDFQGQGFTAVEYKGQPAVVAQELGRLLGYARDGRVFTNKLQQWGEHIEGQDMHTISGPELAAFKGDTDSVSPFASRAVLLTESGITLALARSAKPEGRAFRRFLVDVVLPAFREQQAAPPAPPAPPAAPPPPKRARAPRRDTRGPATRYQNPANLPQEIAPHPGQTGWDGYRYKMSDLCELLGLDQNMRSTLGKWMKAAGMHSDPRYCLLVWATVTEPGMHPTKQRRYWWTPAALHGAKIILRKRRIAHAGYTPRAMVKA